MHRSALALCSAAALLVAAPAAAQDAGIAQSWTSSQLLLNAERRAWAVPECVDDARGTVDCARARPTAPAPAYDPAKLTFRPSLDVRRRNFAQFVARTRAVDPAGADALRSALNDRVIDVIGTAIAPYGLRTNSVADAMALYVMQAWEVVTDRDLPPSRARAAAVSRQMARAIAFTPAFLDASDAEKQELAEAMLIHAAMAGDAAAAARQAGPAQLAQVRAAVGQGARATLGFDLATLTLTDAGFREGRASAGQ